MSAWCLLLNGTYIISKEGQEKIARTLIRLKSIQCGWIEPKGIVKNTGPGLPLHSQQRDPPQKLFICSHCLLQITLDSSRGCNICHSRLSVRPSALGYLCRRMPLFWALPIANQRKALCPRLYHKSKGGKHFCRSGSFATPWASSGRPALFQRSCCGAGELADETQRVP